MAYNGGSSDGNKEYYAWAKMEGFTRGQANDLRSHGIKPSDAEAKHFVQELGKARRSYDAQQRPSAFERRLEEKPENCGYTDRRVAEALSYGVKPWQTQEMESLGRELAGQRRWATRRENESARAEAARRGYQN